MSSGIENNSGIYILENSVNGKCYIGQSKDIERRIKQHFRNKHLIGRALRKYGLHNFMLTKYQIEAKASRDFFEIELIKRYDSINKGYNLTQGGEGTIGYILTPEARKKMSLASRGKPKSEHMRKKLSAAKTGKPISDKLRAAMSSLEYKNKMSEIKSKQKLSEEHKKVFSFRGHHHTVKSKNILRQQHTGRKLSEEHRKKISLGGYRRWRRVHGQ